MLDPLSIQPPSRATNSQGEPSIIVANEGQVASKQMLAPLAIVETRLDSFRVVQHSKGLPIHLGDLLVSNGVFRILLLAGKASNPAQMERFEQFAIGTVGSLAEQMPIPLDSTARSRWERFCSPQSTDLHMNPGTT